jgi:uncharacterized membrane protein YeaQ/YmgE (transglycosylase-associated protein family)
VGILYLILFGLMIGGLARWAVPGPDPMPLWLTVMIGYAGVLIGGSIAIAIFGFDAKNPTGAQAGAQIGASIVAAAVIVILYRRFVQRRPLIGPEAYEFPTRGIGIDRLRGRRAASTPLSRRQALDRIDELHAEGKLTDEEYLERRRTVLRQG